MNIGESVRLLRLFTHDIQYPISWIQCTFLTLYFLYLFCCLSFWLLTVNANPQLCTQSQKLVQLFVGFCNFDSFFDFCIGINKLT